MRPPRLILAAAAAPLLAAGCTAPGAPAAASGQSEARQCFHPSSVNSFTPTDDDAVIVRVSARDHYRLAFIGPCPDIDWSQRIAIRSRGSTWVCGGLDADLIVPGPLGPQLCPVTAIRKLSEAEVEALRNR